MQIKQITKSDPAYPDLLKELVDGPKSLHYIGDLSILDDPCIAIVGTRKSSEYGEYLTNKLIEELSPYSINIVSGLALGIDSFAHKAALRNKLKTIAVIGSGLENIYPRQNVKLSNQIAQSGLLISEYSSLTPPLKHHFPQRNRIISGISIATVVIEAPERSGSLITAYLALDQCREVFTFPGDIDRENSLGPLKLIQKNVAHPIQSGSDLIEILNLNSHLFKPNTTTPEMTVRKPRSVNFSPKLKHVEKALLDLISSSRFTSLHSIQEKSGLAIEDILVAISSLEIFNFIETRDGKYRRRC